MTFAWQGNRIDGGKQQVHKHGTAQLSWSGSRKANFEGYAVQQWLAIKQAELNQVVICSQKLNSCSNLAKRSPILGCSEQRVVQAMIWSDSWIADEAQKANWQTSRSRWLWLKSLTMVYDYWQLILWEQNMFSYLICTHKGNYDGLLIEIALKY